MQKNVERTEALQKEVDKTGLSVDEFAKRMQGLASSFDKLTQSVDKNTAAQNKVAEAGKKAADAEKQGADKATDAIDKTGKATDELGRKLKKTGDDGAEGFGKLQKAAAGFFTIAAAKEFGQKIFEVRSEIQSLQTSFDVLVGNKQQAEELFNSIKDFATHTPMQLKDLASAAQTMMSFNIPVEQIMDNLKALGDVSMGDAQKFQSLSLAFSQMSATGKLMGQDLLQMINAGFNPLATMSEKTGKSISELKDEMSKGAISADMVRQAFIDATSEGGKFAGMLEKQSQALGGAYSNLEGAINDMFNDIGEKSEGIMAGGINAATVLVQNYETVGKVIMSLVGIYGVYKTALMVNIALEKVQAMNRLASIKGVTAMQVATGLLTGKLKALNAVLMANPYALAAAAVAALGAAIYAAASEASEMEEAQRRLDEQTRENESSVLSEMRNLDSLNRQLQECEKGTEQYRKVKQSIIDQYGQYYSGLDAELEKVGNLSGVYDQLTEAIRRSIGARNLKSFYDKEMDNYDKTVSEKLDKAYDVLQDKYGKDEGSRLYHEVFRKVSDKNYKISEKDMDKLGKAKFWGVRLGGDASDGLADFRLSVGRLVREIDDAKEASDEALKKYKDMYEITDEQWNEAIYGGNKSGGTTPPSPTPLKGKGGKKGSKVDHTAEQDAQRRQKLFEIEQRELERQATEKANLASVMADLEIASEADASKREQLQREKDHQASLAAIDRQVEEWKKANYEAAKEKWEATNKDKKISFSDTEEGKAGWKGQKLTGVQDATRLAMIQAENAKEEQAARERAQNLIAAHQSYTDRKIQLDKEYANTVKQIDEEIAAANARGDQESVEALERTKRQAATDHAKDQSALSLDILKESPEYIRAFEDLQQTSTETLEYLIDEFEKAKEAAAKSLDPKDLKEYTDTIQRMQDEVSSRNPFWTLKKAMDELNASEKDMKAANARLELAKKKVKAAKEEGASIKVVKKAEEEMKKAQKDSNKATDEYLKKKNKVKDAGENAAALFSKIGEEMNQVSSMIPGIGGEIAGIISDVAGLATSLITALTFTAQGATAAIRAVETASVILAVISAALQVVQGIMSLLGNNDGYAEAKAQYDALVKVWDDLIDKKREYMKISWGDETRQAREETLRWLKIEEEATRTLAKGVLDVTNKSHSMEYRMWQGSYEYNGQNWQDVADEISKHFGGIKFTSMADMTNMTAEQLEWIKGEYHGLWAVMDDDFREYLEKIIEFSQTEMDILEEAKERITGFSFDTAYDELMDYMYDIADGSEDVMDDIAENWQQMINRMVVNNILGNRMKADLESWYNELSDIQEAKNKELSDLEDDLKNKRITEYSYNISLDDINKRYEESIEKAKKGYSDIVDSGKKEIEELTELGIIKHIEDATDEIKVYFDDLKDSWKETLSDMSATTEDWKNELIDQVLSDLVESTILNAPLAVMVDGAEKQFDDFNKYLEDWTDRYKAIIEDQTLTDEERTARLKAMIQEQTDVREKQAAKSRSLAEGIGKDMKEAFSNSLDNLGDTLLDALLNTEKDAESMGREIASTLIKEMLQTMLASEKYSSEIAKIKEKWQQVLTGKNTDEEGNILFTMDDVLQQVSDLNDTIANDEAIKLLAGQYQELNKQIKNTDSLFGSIKDTFASSMMDMNKTADEMASDIGQTIAKNIIEQMVVSSAVKPLVDNLQKAFDAANVEGATYSSVIGDEAVQNALAELKEAFPGLQETAKGIMTGLGVKMNETAKQGFSDLKGTFVNTLTDMDADAETLGKNLGKSMMEQMLNAMVEKEYKDDLKNINDEWADALEAGDPARLESIKQKAEDLFATIENDQSIKKLADEIKSLTDSTSASPFDNLRSSFLSALTDMSKSTADFTKDISTMIAESFVDSFVMGDMFDEKLAEWKKKYKAITTDSSLSEEQRMKQLKGLSELIAGERDAMKDEVSEIYKMLGIREGQDQSATMNMAEAATYDQFELYLGMETSHLMVAEETKGLVAQVLSTLQGMSSLTNPSQNYGEQIFMRLGTTNEYLLAVKKAAEGIRKEFALKLDLMNSHLSKL